MIKRITIKKLFGYFNHTIKLNLDEPLTIIHGPNGCGKTTILRLLSAVFSRNLRSLMATPYDTIVLDFTDRSTLRIRRKEVRRRGAETVSLPMMEREVGPFVDEDMLRSAWLAAEDKLSTVSLSFVFRKPGLKTPKRHSCRQYCEFEDTLAFMDLVEHRFPFLQRIGPSSWVDRRTGRRLDREQVVRRWGRHFSHPQYYERHIPRWLLRCMQCVKTEFIETQRLLAPQPQQRERSRGEEMASAVLMYSQELAKTIQHTLAQSAALSQGMDRDFPRRVLTERMPNVTEISIRQKYVEQAEKRKRLMDAGLIDKEHAVELPKQSLDKTEMKILWCYLTDVIKKLDVFDDLLRKIELLKSSLNSRFRHKKLTIHKTKGMIFATESGQELPPDALSSGEQHEVVLTYKLLFKVEPGSLILIDEPELSLHVTWQHKFIEDMMQIARLSNLQLLVATHSPQIIHSRWDLTVRLGEPR